MKVLRIAGAILLVASAAEARVEAVFVRKAMDNRAIIVRASGETYLIENGVGCLSLWRYEGKRVYISSPGFFLGIGSSLLIPGLEQHCRIWSSEFLGSVSGPHVYQRPNNSAVSPPQGDQEETVTFIQRALRILGYNVVIDGILDDKTMKALALYQATKNQPRTRAGIRLTLLSLGADVLGQKPPPSDALQIAVGLYRAARNDNNAERPTAGGCVDGHWISAVMDDGRLIKLEDDSIWEVDAVDAVDSILWLPPEEVLICGESLVNTDNGERVGARRLK